jgi:cold-inducible RNA-binding protein
MLSGRLWPRIVVFPLIPTIPDGLSIFFRESVIVGKKVFVGGLSWNTNDDGLRQAFERFGAVDEAKVIQDRETGRSRGFGFVTFSSDDDARSAIAGMDGQQLDGRTVKVNEAEEKPRSSGGGGGSRGGGGGRGGFGGGGGNRW